MAKIELFGSGRCEHTGNMREWLEWRRVEFIEYDVDADPDARLRLKALGGQRLVPTLVEDDVVVQVGWQGRGCVVDLGD